MLSHREPTDEMLADISARLGRVCQSYSADEFTELVRQIAAVQVKYDVMRAETFFDAVRELAADRKRQSRSTSISKGAEPL